MNEQKSQISEHDKARFERDGYHLLRGLFSPEESRQYRHEIDVALGVAGAGGDVANIGKKTHTLADGVTNTPAFWPLIFNPTLTQTVSALLGGPIRYTQHSDLHINLPGGRWHRDSAHRDFNVGPDWDESDEPYRVVRIAIYLSQFEDSGSSLLLLPGSHRSESWLNRREYVTWNKLRSAIRRRNRNDALPHIFLSRPCLRLKTQPGDCVIFDQRLMHAGGVLRGPNPKYAIYLSYGLENQHSYNHRAFFLDRPTYSPEIPEELREKLKAASLLLPDAA